VAEDNSNLIIIPPEPPSQNEMVRLAFALEAISDARRFGDARSDDEVVAASGQYPSAAAFWRALLAVPLRALRFTDLLLTFRTDPSDDLAKHNIKRLEIEHAVLEGIRNGAAWIFLDPLVTDGKYGFLGSMRVHPRDAALWLLSSPWAHLVPPSMTTFLEASPRAPLAPLTVAAPSCAAPRLGRPDDLSQRIMDAMRDALERRTLTPEQLRTEPGKALVARFGASRTTCREARKKVLAEIVGNDFRQLLDK